MTLLEAINNYCIENIDESNDWYNWRKINESKIPGGIVLPKGNQYKKNLMLKEKLHQSWKLESNPSERAKYIEYYITSWGGIHRNSEESMSEYTSKSPSELINKGIKGIASWSKALVIHDPENYAIFDARVSTSLNCIQIIKDIEKKRLHPLLQSRNKVIVEANEVIKNRAMLENWEKVEEFKFYSEYLNMLKEVAKTRELNISTIEMLLFAKATDLVRKLKTLPNRSVYAIGFPHRENFLAKKDR